MSKHSAAFMSYVRFDDIHEVGRLTQLRDRLANEIRMQSGEEFPIFQDRKDIAWGQQWKDRIEESLDAVTFLIPIITPGFFKSKACRYELERFLHREQQLGRNDLILPIYYVTSDVLEDGSKCREDPLATNIAARQFVDWRELRFESFTSPTAGTRLAAMARQVIQATKRMPSPSPLLLDTAKETPRAAERVDSFENHNRAWQDVIGGTQPSPITDGQSAVSVTAAIADAASAQTTRPRPERRRIVWTGVLLNLCLFVSLGVLVEWAWSSRNVAHVLHPFVGISAVLLASGLPASWLLSKKHPWIDNLWQWTRSCVLAQPVRAAGLCLALLAIATVIAMANELPLRLTRSRLQDPSFCVGVDSRGESVFLAEKQPSFEFSPWTTKKIHCLKRKAGGNVDIEKLSRLTPLHVAILDDAFRVSGEIEDSIVGSRVHILIGQTWLWRPLFGLSDIRPMGNESIARLMGLENKVSEDLHHRPAYLVFRSTTDAVEVEVGTRNLSLELLRKGRASANSDLAEYADAEKQAQTTRIGIWQTAPEPSPRPHPSQPEDAVRGNEPTGGLVMHVVAKRRWASGKEKNAYVYMFEGTAFLRKVDRIEMSAFESSGRPMNGPIAQKSCGGAKWEFIGNGLQHDCPLAKLDTNCECGFSLTSDMCSRDVRMRVLLRDGASKRIMMNGCDLVGESGGGAASRGRIARVSYLGPDQWTSTTLGSDEPVSCGTDCPRPAR